MTDLWTSVAEYAALEAQIARSAGNRAKVLADAKLDGLALARLRAAWDVRFTQDRSIEEAYETALEGPAPTPEPEPEPQRRTLGIEEPAPPVAPRTPALEASRWAAHVPSAPPQMWAPVPLGMQHFSGVRETEIGSNLPPGPALPFAPSTGSPPLELGRPAEEQRSPGIARPPARLSGTALAVDVPSRPALPFGQSPGAPPASAAKQPGAPLELTVDQYALLRAHLAVNGEGDQATWEQFGVRSAADRHGIQAGFAARFKQDPTMQARFVEMVPRLIAQLRRQGAGQ